MDNEFYVQGDDDKEYGPIGLEELAVWVREDRVGVGTRVRRAGDDLPWRRWEDFSELMALLAWNPAGAPLLAESEMVIAPFYKRMLAFSIDIFLLIFSVGMGVSVGFELIHVDPAILSQRDLLHLLKEPHMLSFLIILNVIFTSAQVFYFGFCHGRSGQTLGKRLVRIRVVDLSGRRLSWGMAWWRAVASIVSGELYGFGYLVALFSAKTRTLHDWAARTIVVCDPQSLSQR